MKANCKSMLRRALKDEGGQVIPWVVMMMIMFLGIGAFVLDVGHGYYCLHELQTATDAAALAGAQQLSGTNAVSTAISYSAVSGDLNAYPNLGSVSMVPGYPQTTCTTTVATLGGPCLPPNGVNTLVVKQQAMIPTFFAQVFGINQLAISATATAAIAGSKPYPYNIAIVLDTTASMTTVDSNCTSTGGSAERIVCAEEGVAGFLAHLTPCNYITGCGTMTNGTAQYPLDSVAIFTFPNATEGTVNKDYDCSSSNPTIPVYSFPIIGASSYSGAYSSGSSVATYQVTPFLNDYKLLDSDLTLTGTSSDLAMAVGSGMQSGSSCPGMGAPGGDGTYYAGAIYAAQAALTAKAASDLVNQANLTPTNVMMILSDGEANASSSKMATKMTNGTTSVNSSNPWPGGGGATSSITNYPSALDQCQQAVAAANYAKSQGTLVYTIAYGSESSGCTTDTTGPQANITPCQVMGQMASPTVTSSSGKVTNYFYSDYNQSGSSSSCTATGTSVVYMDQIFLQIAQDFMKARLIPNGSS